MNPNARPQMSRAGLAPTHPVEVVDEYGAVQEVRIAGERALTLYVNKREIVTLMTLGAEPEALVLGYLKNQGFVERLGEVRSIQVDWETEAAAVVVEADTGSWEQRLAQRTVTSGCGQGTMFGRLLDRLDSVELAPVVVQQSAIYRLLDNLSDHNDVYRRAGAVHSCGLCGGDRALYFVEDVGRHNAVDAIAGMMWLDRVGGRDKVFYTTGRLTSEMVIKVAQMEVPVLLSRSGVTQMGLELAHRLGIVLIGRAKGRHFQIYTGGDRVRFDAIPERRAPAVPLRGVRRHG